MALLRRARKDVSMAALVEAHRLHVAQGDEGTDDVIGSRQHHLSPRRQRRTPKLHFHSRGGSSDDDDDDDDDDNVSDGIRSHARRLPPPLPLTGRESRRRRLPSAQFSESDAITVADSDDIATPDSQGFREYANSSGAAAAASSSQHSAMFHFTPPLQRKHETSGLIPEPSGDARCGQRRPGAKVSSALRKPMQMMRDRGVAQRRARGEDDHFATAGGSAALCDGGEPDPKNDAACASPVTVDALGVVKVDAALIRYIDETLVKPNHQVFNAVTRFFLDRHLERIYQDYTAVSWFTRARWHIALLILVHLLVMLLFLVLPPSGFEKTDQFILSPAVASSYLQWLYLLVAVPFAGLPCHCNPFQKRWRIWACLIVVLFNSAFQLWLAHAGQLALAQFRGIVTDQLHCSAANTAPVNTTKLMHVNSSSSGSGSAAWVEKTLDQTQYVLTATDLYANGLTQVLTGFTVLFVFILVISIRLEFVYVMAVGLSALASSMVIVLGFGFHLEWLTAFTHAFA
ncbi:hypothetical protein PybrP1_005054, partial [[Pythium] brassicae (nom. inval.)]